MLRRSYEETAPVQFILVSFAVTLLCCRQTVEVNVLASVSGLVKVKR